MGQEKDEVVERFGQKWIEEFSRAVETFAGEAPTLTVSRTQLEEEAEFMAGLVWWQQAAENEDSFLIWVGGTEATWTAVGGALGNTTDAQATFFEMLSQSNQGAVAAMSAKFASPLQCQEGTKEALPARPDLELSKVKISFKGADLEPLLLVLDPAAVRILSPVVETKPPLIKELAMANPSQHSAILERLMDLQLPVSVLLGKATMKIKDVLKVTPGSVIELDRRIGDYVEIMVHGKVVAKGEIVSVKGNYGVRIKEVISRQDRLALHDAA
jgi:flagellar motor switch protein FliN